jgi:hypothetical protein
VGDGSQARALRIAAGQFELQHALPIQAPKSLAARTALAPPRQVDANPIDAPLDPKPHAGEYPEPFAASRLTTLLGAAEPVETGDLLVVDPARPDSVLRARDAEDRRVLGVAVSNTGPDGSRVEVALSGVTLCKVDAAYGPVQPGDLLTSSPTLGHAMRSDSPRPGSLVGKALEPLESGTGVIRIAVTLH